MSQESSVTHPTSNPNLALFVKLLSVPAPSGYEAQIGAIVRSELATLGYTHQTDSAGNILVRLPGRQAEAPLLCLAAHIDEIGMVVTNVEADGSLRVTPSTDGREQFAAQMKAADKVIRRYRNTLRELAK